MKAPTKAGSMQFLAVTWGLLLLGLVAFVLSLVLSIRAPSRAQKLLMWAGLGLVLASLATLIVRP